MPGLWVFTRFEPNERLELVRIIEGDLVEQMRIHLVDNEDGSCTGTWTMTFTALNERGDAAVDALPDSDPVFQDVVIDGLEHYVTTGELHRRTV